MLEVGLTGGVASGKTTVASMLAQKGALVIDADKVARNVVKPYMPAWDEIVNLFGNDFLYPDGTLNRQLLGERVFKDKTMRRRLEEIIHPRVHGEINRMRRKLEQEHPAGILVLDVPLLIETGMYECVDIVVVVTAPEEVQLKRLQKRNRLSRENALLRIRAQMPLHKKKSYADYVIDNIGSLEETSKQVDSLWEEIQKVLKGQ